MKRQKKATLKKKQGYSILLAYKRVTREVARKEQARKLNKILNY